MSRISFFGMIVVLLAAMSAANASIMVVVSNFETGEGWTSKQIMSATPLYGGSIVKIGLGPRYSVHMFGAEYREVLRQNHIKTLAGKTVTWRVDYGERSICSVVDALRIGIQGQPERLRIGPLD